MATTDLRKWFTTIIVDKSASDNAQVPKVATVTIYKQGATVNGSATVTPGGTAVTVRDVGRLEVNDDIALDTETTPHLRVSSIDSATQVTLTSTTGDDVTVDDGVRLVPVTNQPTIYTDVTGVGTTDNPLTTDSSGFVRAYLTERVFDYKVSATGITTTLYEDEESGQRPPRRSHYNVMDYVSVAAAIAAVPRGRKLYFPAEEGPYIPPDANGWEITDAIEIFSDGKRIPEDMGFWPYGAPNGENSTVFRLVGSGSSQSIGFHLYDTVISGNTAPPAANGTGDYIRYAGSDGYGQIYIENVGMFYAGRSAVYLDGSSDAIVTVEMKNCQVYGCGGHGIYFVGCHQIEFGQCSFTHNHGHGAHIADSGDGILIHNCDFAANGDRLTATSTATLPDIFGVLYNAQLYMGNVTDAHITANNFEDFNTSNQTYSIIGAMCNACRAITFSSNEFDTYSDFTGTMGIQLRGGCVGCVILPNAFSLVDILVNVNSASEEYSNVIFPQRATNVTATSVGKIVTPTNDRNLVYVTNRPSGVADNKLVGIRLPNLNSAAGDPTTDVDSSVRSEGLLCYNSVDNKLYLYDGSAFVSVDVT